MTTEESHQLALQLAAVATALDALNAGQLALHVAISNMRDETTPTSVRAKLILSFVTQWQALQKHIGS